MALVNKLRTLLGGDDETYHYQCTSCEAEFESQRADMSKVECPECDSTRVRGISG